MRKSMANSATKTRWLCHRCSKYLSSKRSYDEHMNIHNKARPFVCDQCDYAAASQMTLRRHKLRNHIPRQAWGYRCPHCTEAFMEPASYQQHVLSRHLGRSATFGCQVCSFTTKCSRQFQQHLTKHVSIRTIRVGAVSAANARGAGSGCSPNFSRYLVDDELGSGYGKTPARPIIYRISGSHLRDSGLALTKTDKGGGIAAPLAKFAKRLALDADFLKSPLETRRRMPSSGSGVEMNHEQHEEDGSLDANEALWMEVETEVVVEDGMVEEAEPLPSGVVPADRSTTYRYTDGQVDLDLD